MTRPKILAVHSVNCTVCGNAFMAVIRATKAKYCGEDCREAARKGRYRSANPHTSPKRWRPDEIDYLWNNYRDLGHKRCARHLGRGITGVSKKASELGLACRDWTEEDENFLRCNAVHGATVVAKKVRRSVHAVRMRAKLIGVVIGEPRKAEPNWRTKLLATLIAGKHGCKTSDIFSTSRLTHVVEARHEVAHELRLARYSTPKIGRHLGMDHSSVIHGLKRHARVTAQVGAE